MKKLSSLFIVTVMVLISTMTLHGETIPEQSIVGKTLEIEEDRNIVNDSINEIDTDVYDAPVESIEITNGYYIVHYIIPAVIMVSCAVALAITVTCIDKHIHRKT